MNDAPVNDPASPATTPRQRAELGAELDRLLGTQLAAVRRRFLLHGLAATLLLPAAAILLAFLLDHFLRLPAPIRVFHTLVILALLGWAAVRFLRYPLSRRLSNIDVAVALERTFPDLHQRLVSAIQLKTALTAEAPRAAAATSGQAHAASEQPGRGDQPGPGDQSALRNQSAAMIEQLLQETAEQARGLPFERMFDSRRTARLWAGAAAVLALVLGGGLSAPDTAGAFVLRHLGRDVPYPRATRLLVELPPAGADLQRRDSDGLSELILPAGADLHVSVLAEGVVPDEVLLDVTSGGGDRRAVATSPRGNGRFRHVFRRVTGSFEFRARGGDDDRGDRLVRVATIHPPLVAQIKAELQPPAYTGRESTVQSGGAVEALVGTRVVLSVTATNDVREATLTFLESGKQVAMERVTLTDDAGTVVVHSGEFVVADSDRYQVELVGESGLRNPTPGTYPVTALQDYAPVGRWLLPDDESGTLLLPEAVLCVRGQARDDFGLVNGMLTIDAGDGRSTRRALLEAAAGEQPDQLPTELPTELLFVELVEVGELLGQQRSADGLSLLVTWTDNRRPEPSVTELPRRQVQIVDQAQLAAAIGRLFRGLREEVEQALDVQRDRRSRLEDLLAEGAAPNAATAQLLTAVEVGQGRIQTTTDRLHRGMMRAFDTHLWNRLDPSPNAQEVVDLYASWHRGFASAVPHQPEFYRELRKRRQEGTLGAMEQTLDPILAMVTGSDRLATELAPPALRLLAEAQVARSAADLEQTLRQAVEAQGRIEAALEDLLARLEEWNDYQDLVQEARALREKQRDVQKRTEELRGRR